MTWDIYFGIVIGVFALLIGSFLNVCIYRIPLKQSVVKVNSHCFSCNKPIKPYDLIPILSYLFLGGKCRSCKEKISVRYPLIEFLNLALYIILYIQFGLSLKTVLYCFLSSIMIVVSMIDIDTGEIPDRLHIAVLILSPFTFFIGDILWWERLIGFGAASLILLVLAMITNGFGGGDIKLMAVCGIFLGYKNILLALLIGVVIGGVLGGITMLTSKDKKSIPFGPSLCIGIYLSALFGTKLLNWYLQTFF